MTLIYDSTLIKSEQSSITFDVISSNTELLYETSHEFYGTIKFVFNILSYIALILFFLSLTHKLIGA